MLQNYFKAAYRNLQKHGASSFVNITGLSVGMAVVMLIGLWIWDELSFDTYHQNYKHIAELIQKEKFLGGNRVWDHMPYPLINELKRNFKDQFKHVVPAISTDGYVVSSGEKKLKSPGLFIDESGPEMLTLKMHSGNRSGLNNPQAVLIAGSLAKALFGDSDPVGKPVSFPNEWDPDAKLNVLVAGVYEDLPQNSSFHEVQFLLPWQLYIDHNKWAIANGWEDHRFRVYVELLQDANFSDVDQRIRNAELNIIKHLGNMQNEISANPKLFLHPMSRWHLYSDFKDGVADEGPMEFVWLVGIIGGFVLLLACINFMNLSTARSEKRAKEVGIRKTIGSLRSQLIGQFLSESLLVVLVAFVASVLIVIASLPSFNNLSEKQLHIPLDNGWFWISCTTFILVTSLLAGSYPALYLSSFKPVRVLKGTFRAGPLAAISRKGLVVFQFCISVCLIICTITVYKQILFAKNRPIGYNRNGLLMIPINSQDLQGKLDILQDEVKKTGAISEIAVSESPVTDVSSNNGGFTWKGKPEGLEENFGTLTVSYDYGKTVGWEFLEGRDFSEELNTDSSGFVINETAARFMGLAHPVGETIRWKSKWLGFDKDFIIIGVIKDMVMQSPYEPVKPTLFRLGGNANWIFARISPHSSVTSALSRIGPVFKSIAPDTPFEYKFVDDEFARKFSKEERIGKLAALFTFLAIFISCMGLYGMASFVAEQRVKEIGVRKVLGASVVSLWRLLSREFLVLVVLALLIAVPATSVFMHNWLLHYHYRTQLSWWIFMGAGAGALMITLLTVSYQSIRAALVNPVNALRTE